MEISTKPAKPDKPVTLSQIPLILAKVAEMIATAVEGFTARFTGIETKLRGLDNIERNVNDAVNTAISKRMSEADTIVKEAITRYFTSNDFLERFMTAASTNPKALPSLIKWLQSSQEGFMLLGRLVGNYNAELEERSETFTNMLGDEAKGHEREITNIAKLHMSAGESVEPEHLRAFLLREWTALGFTLAEAEPSDEEMATRLSTIDGVTAQMKRLIKPEKCTELEAEFKLIARAFIRRSATKRTLDELALVVKAKFGDAVFIGA